MTIKTTTATITTATIKPIVTYAAAYAALSAVAERLKAAGTAASIDTLAEDVRAARYNYELCRGRLAAIRAEIDAEIASDRNSAGA